jgi:hypothetical protein
MNPKMTSILISNIWVGAALIGALTWSHSGFASAGSATSGGADLDTCGGIGSIADLQERSSQLASKEKNAELFKAYFADPSFYNFLNDDEIRSGIYHYLESIPGGDQILAVRAQLEFKKVDAIIPQLPTGFKPSLGSSFTLGCEKKQLALQYFPTHTVYVSQSMYSKLSKVEQVLFEIHEAYLAELHPQIADLGALEKAVRAHVADIYTDYERFNNTLIAAHSEHAAQTVAKAWTGAVFIQNGQGWSDQEGFTWSDRIQSSDVSFERAAQICADLGERLPTIGEVRKLSWYLGTLPKHGYDPRQNQNLVLPHVGWGAYWAADGTVYTFNGVDLGTPSGLDQTSSVRCVSQK